MKKMKVLAAVLALALCIAATGVATAFADVIETEAIPMLELSVGGGTEKVTLAAADTDQKVTLADNQFLAINMDVKAILNAEGTANNADQYVVIHIYGNDTLATQGSAIANQTSIGTVIDCKWGNWFFIPASFDGIIYIPVGTRGLAGLTLNSITFESDGRTNQFYIKDIFVCDDTTATSGTSVMNFDFENTDGAITDPRVTFTPVGEAALKSYAKLVPATVTVKGAFVEQDPLEMLQVGVKAKNAGWEEVSGYGHFDIPVETPFTLADGLSLNLANVSGTVYYRVLLVDENDATFMANNGITYRYHTAADSATTMKTLYNAILMDQNVPAAGTVYFPRESFAGIESAGKIKAIRIAMDMQYGAGRIMAIGKICNVTSAAATPVVDWAGVESFDLAGHAIGEGAYITNWFGGIRTLDQAYEITATANEFGSASYAVDGNNVTFTATANKDCLFVSATLNGEEIALTDGKYTATNVTSDLAFVATFRALTIEELYDFTATGDEFGSASYTVEGNTVVFTATANTDCTLVSAKLNGVEVELTDGKYTATNVTSNLAFVATFRALTIEEKYDFTATANEFGSASYAVDGNNVTFTATANKDCVFVSATLNGEAVTLTDGKYTATNVTSDLAFVATFRALTIEELYDFTATANEFGSATYTVEGNTVVFTATANKDCAFVSATLNGGAVTLTDGKYTATNVTSNLTFVATFRALTMEEKYDFTATANEFGAASYAVEGNTVVFTATANKDCVLVSATLNGEAVTLTDGKYTATNVTSDLAFVATFRALTIEELYDFTATGDDFGTATYTVEGNTVVFTATANTDCTLVSATLNGEAVTLTDGKYTATNVTSNLAFVATFRALTIEELYDFTATANEFGSATYTVEGNSVIFTAVANEGYQIALVTLNGEEITLTDGEYVVQNVTGDLAFTVEFAAIPKKGCGGSATAAVLAGALLALCAAGVLLAKKARA